jgi:hypothetical protein
MCLGGDILFQHFSSGNLPQFLFITSGYRILVYEAALLNKTYVDPVVENMEMRI